MYSGERLTSGSGMHGGASSGASRFVQRAVGSVGLVLLAGAALMFSAVLFVVLAVLGMLAWGYLWWKTRAIRRQQARWTATGASRGSASRTEAAGLVLEGEVIREVREPGDGAR